jgi:hypothetical protein
MGHKKEIAEMAIIHAIPQWAVTKPGRLQNLLSRLQKNAEIELSRLKATTWEKAEIDKICNKFFDEVGWRNRAKHILTYMSFISNIIDGRFGWYMEIVKEIVDYYERKNLAPPACYWAGTTAQEKWDRLWEREDQCR